MHDGHYGLSVLTWTVGAASLGFLAWNWPPAKIFMGDVGSGFLGFVFAVLALWTANQGLLPVTVWVILLAVFLVDATFTMARRMLARESWSGAHRTHAYQLAVQAGRSHLRVTCAIVAIDAGLVVLAALAWLRPAFALPAVGLALAFVGGLWVMVIRDAKRRGLLSTKRGT